MVLSLSCFGHTSSHFCWIHGEKQAVTSAGVLYSWFPRHPATHLPLVASPYLDQHDCFQSVTKPSHLLVLPSLDWMDSVQLQIHFLQSLFYSDDLDHFSSKGDNILNGSKEKRKSHPLEKNINYQ